MSDNLIPLLLTQNQNVRILSFDRMQDVIDIVLGRVSLEAAVAVNAVPHKKI
jgi:hypothetical protein